MPKPPLQSNFPLKYGLSAAGGLSRSLIGQLPGKASSIGPVAGVSYRVASRIANTLHAGYPVRHTSELNLLPIILFHSSRNQMQILLEKLETAEIDWKGKSLIVCDCQICPGAIARFRARGASVAVARQVEIARYLVVEGKGPALSIILRIARDLRLKTIEIAIGSANTFDTAITLGTCALTPLIERASALLRESGVRDIDAPRMAAAIFRQTASNYANSGKQSWGWYVQGPETERMEMQIEAAGPRLGHVFRELLIFGLDVFEKHAAVSDTLRRDRIENAGRARKESLAGRSTAGSPS